MKIKAANSLIYLSPDALLTHPKNLRRFYPDEQVREMAASIKAKKGVYQALQIVPNGQPGKYFVVDGNFRLAGARLLGKDCPLLKCERIEESQAEQLLSMIVTAKFRYDPDPISEALHYKRLIDEEELSVNDISGFTGVASTAIYVRLSLLDLDPEIQELIAHGSLHSDKRVRNALLSIQDVKARIKVAERVARDGMTIKAIVKVCERVAQQLQAASAVEMKAPALTLAKQRTAGRIVHNDKKLKIKEIREAAKATCAKCSVDHFAQEPSWTLLSHVTGETCSRCDLRKLNISCGSCPAVDILRRLIIATGDEK